MTSKVMLPFPVEVIVCMAKLRVGVAGRSGIPGWRASVRAKASAWAKARARPRPGLGQG